MAQSATVFQRLQHIIGDSFGASIVEQTIEKAIKESRERAAEPKSIFYDPLTMFMGRNWLQRTDNQITPQDLRMMARNPIIASIINTRLNQIAAFCIPRSEEYQLGYEITPMDGKTKDPEMQEAIRDWVRTMGIEGYGEALLENFARKFMRDSLTLDQGCAEIVNARDGTPAYTVVIDAGKIKRTRASLSYATPTGSQDPWYCMVVEEQIVAEYAQNEMIFGIRNPQTDMSFVGYGQSEMETLVRTITTLINTEKYNAGQMTQGGTQKGIFTVQGDVDKDQFEIFKRDLREAIRNAANYWRPPVLRIGKDSKVDWVALDRSNRDMEYAALFEYLVKLSCGVYQIDPSEINWSINAAGTKVNFEGNPEKKSGVSRDKGLRPLLTFLANQINLSLVHRMDPRFRLEFLGFDADRQADADVINKEVTTFKTVNEARKERKLPSLGPAGDVILSQYFVPEGDAIEPEAPPGIDEGDVDEGETQPDAANQQANNDVSKTRGQNKPSNDNSDTGDDVED